MPPFSVSRNRNSTLAASPVSSGRTVAAQTPASAESGPSGGRRSATGILSGLPGFRRARPAAAGETGRRSGALLHVRANSSTSSQAATTGTEAREAWSVRSAIDHMSNLSDQRVKRFLKKSASEQYLYAKSLTPGQRGELERALADMVRTGSADEAHAAMTMWLSVQQARLRTHTLPQRLQYEADQYGTVAAFMATIVGTPFIFPQLYLRRNVYYADADRPEYATAFNNFMTMIGDTSVSEGLRNEAASRLAYHAGREGTIAPAERYLLRREGAAGLAGRAYRAVANPLMSTGTYIGSLSADLAEQRQPLGEEIERFLQFAGVASMPHASRFNDEEGANAFARVLARCCEDAKRAGVARPLAHPTIRDGVDVIRAVEKDGELRQFVFAIAVNALGSCSDNVVAGFAEMVSAVRNHEMAENIRNGNVKEPELREWVGKQFRLGALRSEVHKFLSRSLAECDRSLMENHAALEKISPEMGDLARRMGDPGLPDEERAAIFQQIEATRATVDAELANLGTQAQHRNRLETLHQLLRSHHDLDSRRRALVGEPLETMLHAEVALRATLRLPDSVPETMLYRGSSSLSPNDLQRICDAVRQQEADPAIMGKYLLSNDNWKAGIRLLHAKEFAALQMMFDSDETYNLPIPPDGDEHVAEQAAYAAAFKDLEQRQRKAETELFEKYTL